MSISQTAFERIQWCFKDIEEFKDLIEINDDGAEFGKRFKLAKSIAGRKVKNRFENLVVACWSAVDYLKKDIKKEIGSSAATVFQTNLFNHHETDLVQYLADSIKHGGIEQKYLKLNRYKELEPRLNKTILSLSNQSVPGSMKPNFMTEGDVVPDFEVADVKYVVGGIEYTGYDTIFITVNIVDNKDNVLGDVTSLFFKFNSILKREYNRIMRV